MGRNLEFHKMSVPLKDLKKALYTDHLIMIVIHFISFLISLMIPVSIFVPTTTIKQAIHLLNTSPSLLILGALTILIMPVFMRSINLKVDPVKNQFILSKSQKRTLIISILSVAMGSTFLEEPGQGGEGISWLDQFNILFLILLISSSFFVGSIIHYSRKNFNHIRANNFKQHFFSFGIGTFATFLICFLCGFIFRIEVNSPSISAIGKTKSMIVFVDFLPELETDTVIDLMSVTTMFSDELFKKAKPEIYQIPVNEIIKEKNLFAYSKYLQYGKPAESNLIYIMKELETHSDAKDWRKDHFTTYREVKYRLVQHWPAAKSLPDDLIKEKITRKRSLASKKEKTGP